MESYSKTTSVTLTASPEPGSEFAYWDGGCSGLSPTCALTVSTDTSVQAVFMSTKTKKFNLSVVRTKTNRGDGTVVSTDGRIDCGKDCKESYYPGTPVVLTATPLPGSVFTGWSGHCTGTGTCSVTMDKATMVRAAFEGPYMLTVSKVSRKKGGGIVTSSPPGIDCGYDCKESFTKGTSVNLTATPNPGSLLPARERAHAR
jgi:hypothetical protein